MAEVRLVQVSKVYADHVHAVRELSLTVADGERVVLVGPSGCGKTTTLRLIAGLERVTDGQIYLAGQLASRLPPAKRHVAMVFQTPTLYPHLSVRNNLAFGLRIRKTPTDVVQQRVQEAAQMLALDSLLDRWPDELSGGQQQRVALGRAVVRRPQLFLLDEPLSDLDTPWRSRLRSQIVDLHRQLQTTMIYVTHDQAEAMTLGQRIAVLQQGVVQQVDTPLNVYQRPANRFVAGFIGNPSMNFLPATVAQGKVLWEGRCLPVAAPHVNGSVTVGVRPEDLRLHSEGAEAFNGTVDTVERIGHETLVYVEVNGQTFVVRGGPHEAVQPGQNARFMIKPERLHLFASSGTEQRLD